MNKVYLLCFSKVAYLLFFAVNPYAKDTLIHYYQNFAGATQWKYTDVGNNLNVKAWKDLAYFQNGSISINSAYRFCVSALANFNYPVKPGPTNLKVIDMGGMAFKQGQFIYVPGAYLRTLALKGGAYFIDVMTGKGEKK